MSKGLRITLIVSLALNFIFLGAGLTMLGYSVLGPRPHTVFFARHHGPDFMMPIGEFGRTPHLIMGALDEDTRKKMREVLEANRAAIRASFEASRAARREAHEALTAEPFSREALEAALGKVRDADMQSLAQGHKVAVEMVSVLSPEQRAKVGEALIEGRHKLLTKRVHRGPFGWGGGFVKERPEPGDDPDFTAPMPPEDEGAPPEGPPLPP
jgi:Spy/CpxP family protein refolding chaperone